MKHILPLLTIALAFTAATASAADYYDTYANPTVTTSSSTEWREDWNTNVTYQHETVSYGNYEIIKTSYFNQDLSHDSFYKIRVTGNNVDLYITDYIDNIQSSYNNNALSNKGITHYGFRYLESADASKVNGKTVSMDLVPDPEKTQPIEFAQDTTTWQMVIKDPTKTYYYEYPVTRNQYHLGTFNAGDVIEIYMQADAYGEAWSNTNGYIGGYGDGVTDAWDRLAAFQLGLDENAVRKAAPLASICVNGYSQRVFYGLYAKGGTGAVGSPLPGGLPVALVSGLFALGFWYFRRNKAVAV